MAKHKRGRFLADLAEVLKFKSGDLLSDRATDDTPGFSGGEKAGVKLLANQASDLGDLQELLYANRETERAPSVLLVVQGMDTSGKGGIMRHVVGQLDPQGVKLAAFKKPSKTELAHDFLWRIKKQLPEPGFLGVFDRSHYEDVLIGRVRQLAPADEIERRYAAINEFEALLAANNTKLVKVMMHLGKEEQRLRLTERVVRSDKYWKYNPSDVDERLLWDEYQAAYQLALEKCSTPLAPWYVVPADNKWYTRIAVQQLLLGALSELDQDWPPAKFDTEVEYERIQNS